MGTLIVRVLAARSRYCLTGWASGRVCIPVIDLGVPNPCLGTGTHGHRHAQARPSCDWACLCLWSGSLGRAWACPQSLELYVSMAHAGTNRMRPRLIRRLCQSKPFQLTPLRHPSWIVVVYPSLLSLGFLFICSHMHRLGPVLYLLDVRHVETCREALAASSSLRDMPNLNLFLHFYLAEQKIGHVRCLQSSYLVSDRILLGYL